MEALSEGTEERKQRVPFHGMKVYGSASPFSKLHKSKTSSPMGPLKTNEKAVNLLNNESVKFDIKQEPSDFSDNANVGDSGNSSVNNKKHSLSIKDKVGLFDSVTVTSTNKSSKERLKLKSNNIDNNDEIVILSRDFPSNGKQFNWSKKRNACDPGYEYFKSKLNLNSRRTFNIKEKKGNNYMESSSYDCHRSRHVSPTDVNLYNRLEKIIKCEAKPGKSLEESSLPDDSALFCDIKDINLSNKLNEEHCLVKFKEINKNIDKVFIKVEEPCDLEVDENDSGIHIPMHSELTTTAAIKRVAHKHYIKEEPCNRPTEDDENDSGIHSPMSSEISGNTVQLDKLSEVVIKKECESDQNIEPWFPWLPLDASEDPVLLKQKSHEQLIKNEPLEQDLLKQIKDLEPLCVSKKKLANKYISKYQKPQLNETGQTFNCSDCDKSFTMRNLLSHHIIYEHNSPTLKLLKCPICHRRFNKFNGLSNHIRATHKIRRHHICKLCHHSFSRHHYLVYHMRAIHKIVK